MGNAPIAIMNQDHNVVLVSTYEGQDLKLMKIKDNYLSNLINYSGLVVLDKKDNLELENNKKELFEKIQDGLILKSIPSMITSFASGLILDDLSVSGHVLNLALDNGTTPFIANQNYVLLSSKHLKEDESKALSKYTVFDNTEIGSASDGILISKLTSLKNKIDNANAAVANNSEQLFGAKTFSELPIVIFNQMGVNLLGNLTHDNLLQIEIEGVMFVFIIQGLWFVVKDETVGKFLAIIVMVFSLAAGGGTFPAFAQLPFFDFIGMFVPFTYVIQGFTTIVYGSGTMDANLYILQNFGVFFIYIALFFALGFFIGAKNRNRDMNYG
ncbi:hypothetical protein FQA39_LY12986 [Lamprigera yunnana]|nr:hypothetical protein FQA39_LY12986 [Lamprigera yunnana]